MSVIMITFAYLQMSIRITTHFPVKQTYSKW